MKEKNIPLTEAYVKSKGTMARISMIFYATAGFCFLATVPFSVLLLKRYEWIEPFAALSALISFGMAALFDCRIHDLVEHDAIMKRLDKIQQTADSQPSSAGDVANRAAPEK